MGTFFKKQVKKLRSLRARSLDRVEKVVYGIGAKVTKVNYFWPFWLLFGIYLMQCIKKIIKIYNAPVAQLDRASDFGSVG